MDCGEYYKEVDSDVDKFRLFHKETFFDEGFGGELERVTAFCSTTWLQQVLSFAYKTQPKVGSSSASDVERRTVLRAKKPTLIFSPMRVQDLGAVWEMTQVEGTGLRRPSPSSYHGQPLTSSKWDALSWQNAP